MSPKDLHRSKFELRRKFNSTIKNAAISLALMPVGVKKVFAHTPSFSSFGVRTWKVQPFKLGVASGVPRSNSVLLWTRLIVDPSDYQCSVETGEPIILRWEVYGDENLQTPIRSGEELTDQSRGHSVRVKVEGLTAGTTYWYRFIVGDAVSDVGRTKTAQEQREMVQAMRFALASCQNFQAGEYAAYKDMLEQDLDFVLFVGDYIYETNIAESKSLRMHRGVEPKTLEQYRDRYAQYKEDPLLQAAHARYPWILMWDDHEVANDYANDLDPAYTDPQEFLRRRAAAYRAYFEHQPIEIGPQIKSSFEATMILNDSYSWGQLAELWTLDCRQFRSYHACSAPKNGGGRVLMKCDELEDKTRTMFGLDQEQWLSRGLKASQKTWKLIAQATQMSSTTISTPVGTLTYTDAWDGYPQARKRFLEDVHQNRITNVVTLGGDVHMNVAANLRVQPNDKSSPIVASEFVTTSVTSAGLGKGATGLIKANNSDILHLQAQERGYALISVTPQDLNCEFRTTTHPAKVDGSFRKQGHYFVDSGKAGVVPVSAVK